MGLLRIVSDTQKKVYALEKGYKATVKVGDVLVKGGTFATDGKNGKQKVMEE
ncbi:MAG: hypothetical protein K6E76_08150 [Patescibacteria group bacterium]|jgi:hypothetical protein|nr:hypothetical protein [Patescibacteria group bacterium]